MRTVYMFYVYINTHTCIYIYIYFRKKYVDNILNIFIYNINYRNINIDVNACTFFQNIYCMCVYLLYIINIHRTHTYIMQTKFFILYAIIHD